jgi:transposase-like protein
MAYTLEQFRKDFPNEESCISYIFQNKYGDSFTCPKCSKKGGFHKAKNRRCYACAWCGYQVYPTAGTVFQKSRVKISDWFFVIYLMSNSKNPLQAADIKKYLGISKATAERMITQIGKL